MKSKRKKVAVLGVGRVGEAIAVELSRYYETRVVDVNESVFYCWETKLKKAVFAVKADLRQPDEITAAIKDSDLVVVALPGHLGFSALKAVINAGKPVVDISFFPEDPFELDELAKKKKVAAVVDCGVAPGLSNIILGHHYSKMKIKSFVCYVGGLPKARQWPYEYKAPFSPVDVLEEYTRPARIAENGKIIAKPALSDLEKIEFAKIGTLEAFNTDGLRTLLKTVKVPEMKEKTLRYPGHAGLMAALRETGFFGKNPVFVRGKSNIEVAPIDVLAELLFPLWRLKPDEEEFTVMRVIIEGEEKGKPAEYVYDLYDEYDKTSGFTSMARTTGFTCVAAARLMLENKIKKTGIIPPEFLGMNWNHFEAIMEFLKEKNVKFEIKKS